MGAAFERPALSWSRKPVDSARKASCGEGGSPGETEGVTAQGGHSFPGKPNGTIRLRAARRSPMTRDFVVLDKSEGVVA